MPEPRRIDTSLQAHEVDNIAIDHMLDSGELSSHTPSPVNVADEPRWIADGLSVLLLR
jgi:hypothetical protein